MNPIEIIKQIRSKNPKLLNNIPDAQAANIVRATLDQINSQIDEIEDGVVIVQGLGRFRVKQVEQQKDDKTVTVKRVIFKAKAKAAKPAGKK